MTRTTICISGMGCAMCEAHISEAVRNVFPVKNIKVSRRKGTAVILSETPLDGEKLREIIQRAGYIVQYIAEETVANRGFFHRVRCGLSDPD